ncbi:MAG: hypothetical protein ABR879_03120 [Methanomassiliicoccales archaeon]|jgi:hypothetical protein
MLGLSGSELKEAASLSESVRRVLEEIGSEENDDRWLRQTAIGFKAGVGVSTGDAVRSLRALESAIGAGDPQAMSDVNDLIDSIVDYLVIMIAMMEASSNHGGRAKWRLEHLRRDAGRLAQYVCQMTEGTT